ncbi:hypothetical protein KR222_007884 [Zaprionus bogoriensis]|nr:hypothetical protein KR222_007884 [Zaprionus bogoriensis]
MENEVNTMQTSQEFLKFSELQCLDSEDVASCVSQQTALKICNQSLENLSARTVEVLSLWLRKLLKAYISEAECCVEAFKCLYEWFQRLVGSSSRNNQKFADFYLCLQKDAVSPENKEALSDFATLLSDARDFADWAKEKLLKTSERLAHTAAFFLLSIVCGCLEQRLMERNKSWSQRDIEQATSYWTKCNNCYSMFSLQLSQWHVCRLLKYFHHLGHKQSPLFSLGNYRHLRCVSTGSEQQQQQLWQMRIQRLLMTPLSDKEQYYELVSAWSQSTMRQANRVSRCWQLALMELMTACQSDWLHLIAGSVQELLLGSSHCCQLAGVFFQLALQASKSTQLRILQGALPAAPLLSDCWQLQKFLHACRRSEEPQLKSLAAEHSVAKQLLPLLEAPLHRVEGNAEETTNMKWHYRRRQTHHCQSEASGLKRKRSPNEPKELIQQLEQHTTQLLRCSGELDAGDLLHLRGIVNNLNNMLKNI